LRVPVSEKAFADLQMAVRAHEESQYIEANGAHAGYIIPAPTVEAVDAPLSRKNLLEVVDRPAQ
jgi:hypothetical protein